jgi:hypothetical protein
MPDQDVNRALSARAAALAPAVSASAGATDGAGRLLELLGAAQPAFTQARDESAGFDDAVDRQIWSSPGR